MPATFRRLNRLVPAVATVLLLAFWLSWLQANREPARWFMPGPLGHEPGATPTPPTERAYLTRALGLAAGKEQAEWARANHLTPALAFSHNLGSVVPASLYDANPRLVPARSSPDASSPSRAAPAD